MKSRHEKSERRKSKRSNRKVESASHGHTPHVTRDEGEWMQVEGRRFWTTKAALAHDLGRFAHKCGGPALVVASKGLRDDDLHA